MPPEQKNRQIAISTALGPDSLLLNRMTVSERMNAPFEISAELSSVDAKIELSKVIGNKASIRLDLGEHGKRFFNGYVNRLTQTTNFGGYARYHATLVPWLWFLTRTSDCRVYQRKSAVDIIEEVFQRNHFGSDFYELRSLSACPKRRYCVQYRETDFNFVNRLLESEGIAYWFEHQGTQHKMILADKASASQPRTGYDTLIFRDSGHQVEGMEAVNDWIIEQEVHSVEYDLKDFDFKKPSNPPVGKSEVTRDHGMARFAIYDYPGEHFESSDGERYAKIRLEELQANQSIVRGSTTARGLAVGQTFTLKEHPRGDQNIKYLITSLSLTADAGEFAAGGHQDDFLRCQFEALPFANPFRPPRVTPKPVVQGVQTATVVGPSGEEIHTDEYGRVKIQFHWDRYGKSDQDSSCWVRVAQSWAGKKWGAIAIPRIGQEVVAEFLEGDPDRPIITGSVYNAEQKVPYDLPAEKTKTAVKSNTSKGGVGFNEIRFEDSQGKEQVFVHAERNMDVRVKNDSMEQITGNRHLIVGPPATGESGNQYEHVYKDKHLLVDKDHVEKIGGDAQRLVVGNEDLVVSGTKKEKIDGASHLVISGKRAEHISGDQSLNVGGNQQEKVGMKHAVDAGMEIHLKAGMKVIIEAGMQLSLKAGAGFIDIGPAGVAISGPLVMINSGGAAGSGGGSSPDSAESAKSAAPKEPVKADDAKSGEKSSPS